MTPNEIYICQTLARLTRKDMGVIHPDSNLRLDLKYGPNGERVIRHIKRVSKPGRRIYSGARKLQPVLNGLGIAVISTSRGVLSDREARQKNLGGEVLCELW